MSCLSFHLSPSRPRWFWWMESNADRQFRELPHHGRRVGDEEKTEYEWSAGKQI